MNKCFLMLVRDTRTPAVLLVLTSVLWGVTWIPLKALEAQGVKGLPLLLITHLVLAFIMLPFVYRQRREVLCSRSFYGVFFLGGGASICFNLGMMYGEVIRVMVLFYLMPIWGVLGGRFFLSEPINTVRWLGVLGALMGAFCILGGVNVFEITPHWTDLLGLLAGILFAGNNLIFRGDQILSLPAKLLGIFVGSAFLVAAFLVVTPGNGGWKFGANIWFWLLLYTVTWCLVANVVSLWAISKMEAGRSSLILVVELVVAMVSALILGGEVLSTLEVFGCCLILFAVFLEVFDSMKDKSIAILSD